MPSYLDYWSSQLKYFQVANIMPLKNTRKSEDLFTLLTTTEETTDKFQKVRPVVEKVRLNCLKAGEEEKQFSVDEMTLPYKGKNFPLQYIK